MITLFNFSERIRDFFIDLITDVLDSAFKLIAEVLFNPEQLTGFFLDLYTIFIGIGSMLMVCIVLFKVIQGLLAAAASGESQQAHLGHTVIDTIKACAMIPIMPFVLWVIIGQIVYPLGEFMFRRIGTFSADGVEKLIKRGDIGSVIGDGFMFIIVFGFVCVAVFAFFIKMCIYHADILFLNVLSVFAAISIVADDNNYAGVWWREVLSQITTIIVQVAIMVGVVEILTGSDGGLTWYSFMLLIGLCVLLIRGPSVTRNMWYATGAGKSMIGQGGKLAARVHMVRKVFS